MIWMLVFFVPILVVVAVDVAVDVDVAATWVPVPHPRVGGRCVSPYWEPERPSRNDYLVG